MDPDATVFVVDDDDAVRESLIRLVNSVGLWAEGYPSAEAFLKQYNPARPGCLLLDVRMPGMTGLELQEKLIEQHVRTPVIILSGHGDVEKAVRAMKMGAVDFLRKPYDADELVDRIRQALDLDARNRREDAERTEVAERFAQLTPREREVLDLLVADKSAKQIALILAIDRKTVDAHRGHLMRKLRADSLIGLTRMAQLVAGGPVQHPPRLSGPDSPSSKMDS